MKKVYKIVLSAIIMLMFLYALAFVGVAQEVGYTWQCALITLKIMGISVGISAVIYALMFCLMEWIGD